MQFAADCYILKLPALEGVEPFQKVIIVTLKLAVASVALTQFVVDRK